MKHPELAITYCLASALISLMIHYRGNVHLEPPSDFGWHTCLQITRKCPPWTVSVPFHRKRSSYYVDCFENPWRGSRDVRWKIGIAESTACTNRKTIALIEKTCRPRTQSSTECQVFLCQSYIRNLLKRRGKPRYLGRGEFGQFRMLLKAMTSSSPEDRWDRVLTKFVS